MPVTQTSFTTPGYDYGVDIGRIERQRALAQALQQSSFQPIETPTTPAGGFTPRISPFQGAAKLAEAYFGAKQQKKSDTEQRELTNKIQSDYQSMLARGLSQLQGTPGKTIQPDPQEAQQSADYGTPQVGPATQAPQAPNPMAALQTFGSHPMGQQFVPMVMQEIQRQRLAAALRGGQAASGSPQPSPMNPGGPNPSVMAGSGPAPLQQPQAQSMQPQGMGTGGPAGGMPMEAWLQVDPTGKAYLEALAKERTPINVREGGAVYVPGQQAPMFQNFKTTPGQQITYGPGGPQMSNVPGAIPSMAASAQAQAAATEAGKAPYQLTTLNTPGSPTMMTHEQAIRAATGQPMPQPGAQPGGGGIPQPGQRPIPVSGGRVPGLRLQDQGAGAEQKKYGEQLGEYTAKVQEAAAGAAVSNRYLDNMEMASKDIRLGKLAPAQSALTQWAQAAGIPVSEDAKKAAGSTQALTSMAIKMAGQATRQSDAQPSQLQYFKILESMPNEQRTEDGFRKITAYLRDANNYNIAKMQHLQQWRQTHGGTAEGFEAQWPKVANQLPFVWNQQRRATDLKAIVNSGNENDPLGIRGNNR